MDTSTALPVGTLSRSHVLIPKLITLYALNMYRVFHVNHSPIRKTEDNAEPSALCSGTAGLPHPGDQARSPTRLAGAHWRGSKDPLAQAELPAANRQHQSASCKWAARTFQVPADVTRVDEADQDVSGAVEKQLSEVNSSHHIL